MSRRKKQKFKMPPLTPLDKCIYYFLILLWILLTLAGVFLHYMICNAIAYLDPETVASYSRPETLLILPLFLFLGLSVGLFLITWGLNKKRPIFGSKKITYGPPKWADIYPIFSKKKPYRSLAGHRLCKKYICSWLIALLTFIVIGSLSFCPRFSLQRSGELYTYNTLNQQTDTITKEQFDSITFSVKEVPSPARYHIRYHWTVVLTLEKNGTRYTFELSDFYGNHQNNLQAMLTLKSIYDPSIIHYIGEERIYKVIEEKNLNEESAQLLHDLFFNHPLGG